MTTSETLSQCCLRNASLQTPPVRQWQSYSLYHCPSCDSMFWFPMHNPGADWYEDECLYHLCDEVKKPGALDWHHRQFLRDLPCRGGKLLDVGCGTGALLAAAREAGYDVEGVDFSARAIRLAREIYGLDKVHAMSWEQFFSEHTQRRYDVVTFFEVLEHMDKPTEFLTQVRAVLKPGGFIALSTPNRERLWGKADEVDLPPHHFTLWTASSLRSFLERQDFAVVHLRKQPLDPYSVALALGNVIRFGIGRKVLAKASKQSDQKAMRATAQTAWLLYRFKYAVLTALSVPLLPFLLLARKQGLHLYALAQKR